MDYTYLRLLIDEKIPADGMESNTNFTNEELDKIAESVGSTSDLYLVASEAWRIKAGLIHSQMANIASYALGEESVKYIDLQTQYKHAMALSADYKKKSITGASIATVFSQAPPDILHLEDDEEEGSDTNE